MNKRKVYIYNGPKGGADKMLAQPLSMSFVSLSLLVRTVDNAAKNGEIEDLVQRVFSPLICYGEEFYSVNEYFIHSFWSQIDLLNIQEIYLINPPQHIVEQVNSDRYDVEKLSHTYPSVTKPLLKKLKDDFTDKIIGQDLAKVRILKTLIPQVSDSYKKPIIAMLYGPAGVGKTETAKIIARLLGGEPFRTQFSMMQTNSLADYMFGTKPNERSLTKDLLERSSNVIVFDEFDKTNPMFHSAFYQAFDEGIFEDRNYRVDLSRSVILCTSNYRNVNEIRAHLGDALYSRITSFIEYKPFEKEDKEVIAKKTFQRLYDEFTPDLQSEMGSLEDIINEYILDVISCENAREIESYVRYVLSNVLYKKVIA